MSLLGCNFPKMALKQTTLSVHNKFNSVSHTCFNFPKRMNLSLTRKLTTCCSFWKGKMESHCDAIATVRCIKCQKLCYSTASSRSFYATNSGIVQSVHNNFVLPISTKLKHHSWYVSNNNLHTTAGLSVIPKDIYINPITDLQRLYEIPLLPEMQEIFRPSAQDMRNGEQLFVPSHKNKIKYLSGAVDQDHLPSHDLPEVAFIGRSNVGKSSLIKALFRKVPDLKIRTSKTPGHTRALIFFEVGRLMSVVDMPGYGFHMPTHFVTSVEAYLKSRKKLCRTFILIDATIGVNEQDQIGIAMMEEFKIPYTMILTKIDKVKETTLLRNLLKVNQYREEETQCCLQQIFLLSSITYSGIPLLQAFIGHVTGNLMLESKLTKLEFQMERLGQSLTDRSLPSMLRTRITLNPEGEDNEFRAQWGTHVTEFELSLSLTQLLFDNTSKKLKGQYQVVNGYTASFERCCDSPTAREAELAIAGTTVRHSRLHHSQSPKCRPMKRTTDRRQNNRQSRRNNRQNPNLPDRRQGPSRQQAGSNHKDNRRTRRSDPRPLMDTRSNVAIEKLFQAIKNLRDSRA